jgi:hypothetical protein
VLDQRRELQQERKRNRGNDFSPFNIALHCDTLYSLLNNHSYTVTI